jgi:broad specificity phosphatase PhoE/8-oxo-dGTP pyrophosphatase MutT (NUDIX family)
VAGTLYLIRHGATKLNEGPNREDRIRGWLNPPLIQAGKDQAAADAKKLADSGITRIYSSDLQRAADTAKTIAAALDVPVQDSIDFRPWNLGDLQGDPAKEVASKLRYYAEHPDEKVPGGESFSDFTSRYLSAFKPLYKRTQDGETLAIVTHYRNVKLTQAYLKGGQGIDLDQFFTDDLKPGDIIALSGGKWTDVKKAEAATVSLRRRGYPELVRKADPVAAGIAVRAADTGRVLMLQRSISDPTDPAAGKWEFPGGCLENGETPDDGAVREWEEETGTQLPDGHYAGCWQSGVYHGCVYVIPHESDVPLNLDSDDRAVTNPDDPDGDDCEVLAWWPPTQARANPGLRTEVQGADWTLIAQAVPDAVFKASLRKYPELVAKDSPTSTDVHVDAPMGDISSADLDDNGKKKRKPLKVADTDVQVLKVDDEKRIVYGIVLEPDVEDSQGDVVSKEDVELAAHRFLYQSAPIGIQHGAMAPDSVRPVESYIAPADFELGGQVVKAGTWVLATHVPDEQLWQAVKKDGFGSYSVAGSGKRGPLERVTKEAALPSPQPIIHHTHVHIDKDAIQVGSPVVHAHHDIHVAPSPAPVVHNHVDVAAPVVHAHSDVHVPEQAAPVVNVENHVEAPKPEKAPTRTVDFKRNGMGQITGAKVQ